MFAKYLRRLANEFDSSNILFVNEPVTTNKSLIYIYNR